MRKWIFITCIVFAITMLQLNKRRSQKEFLKDQNQALADAKTPFAKVLFELPVYRDSLFRVYITKVNKVPKLVFLAAANITEKQQESGFFVHVYPKDKKLLQKESKLIAYDFKTKVCSFAYKGENFYFFEENMPALELTKLNLGQYGFRGDKRVSWKISNLLTHETIARVLYDNKQEIPYFEIKADPF